MSVHHGASTIKEWIADLLELAGSGVEFTTSAGAEPGRDYAYLEFHRPERGHSLLLFSVEDTAEGARVQAHRVDGSDEEVRERIRALTKGS